jgi:cell wall-associated NlpC family hydrolase
VSKSTTGRHRADLPVSTPLTGVTGTLTSAFTVPVSAASKGGVVVAVSSGLVAGVALPGSAALPATSPGAKSPTASIPLLGTADAATVTATEPISAASTSRVAFEHDAFSPVAKHASATTSPAGASRQVSRISRSLARAAYEAHARAHATAHVQASAPRVQRHAAVVRTTTRTSRSSAPTRTYIPVAHSSVVAIALRYLGVPYVYGGSSPRGFDCSGFTGYVYGLLGKRLPRTAAQQYSATTRISRSSARPGDLVFFFSGGIVTHVGIYLGGNMMVAAPHTGDVVKRQEIYSANVAFGRV